MDTLFYYYATYLAARLAGMKQQSSQQLAYYCQTMSELQLGSTQLTPWHFQEHKFTPCVTGLGKTELDDGCNDNFGAYNCELAFQRFPALQDAHLEAELESAGVTDVAPIASSTTCLPADRVTCHYYNPLTDVDWQRGATFRPGFSQKLANKHLDVKPAESGTGPYFDWLEGKIELEEGLCSTASGSPEHARLNCAVNSEFSRTMLNDVIYKSSYQSMVKGFGLALLGCRLFTYQNTWEKALATATSVEERAVTLLDAFYWTQYAIQCYLQGKPMENAPDLTETGKPGLNYRLNNSLKALFLFSGERLHGEYIWLRRLPALLADYGKGQSPIFVNWREGLRYRPQHLVEQAMLASGADSQRQIKLIQGFKASHFFKLNKAAEYHTDWLSRQLGHKGLPSCATAQSLGDNDVWQLI